MDSCKKLAGMAGKIGAQQTGSRLCQEIPPPNLGEAGGVCPLHPQNDQMTRITQSSTSLVTAHTPRESAVDHEAIVEVHAPRVRGIERIRRRRPIAGRLHIVERMARG